MSRRSSGCLLLALFVGVLGCGDGPAGPESPNHADSDASARPGPPVDASADAGVKQPTPTRPGTSGRDAAASRDASIDDQANDPVDAGTGVRRDGGGPSATADAAVVQTGDVWKPKPGTTWQWNLSGDVINIGGAADVYDIDGFEADAALVAKLHAMGKKVICYLSVGTHEAGRPDAKDFPKETLGKYWPEWEETYVDIRSEGVRAVMKKRLDMCQSKGFDGVEPDNMDMFEGGMSDTGFPLTEADGVAYARWLATEVHARGMSIGQKNASSITSQIEAVYDWGLTEDCFADGWCDAMKDYPAHGKALFVCEYTDTQVDFAATCSAAKQDKFDPILKNRELDEWVQYCE